MYTLLLSESNLSISTTTVEFYLLLLHIGNYVGVVIVRPTVSRQRCW